MRERLQICEFTSPTFSIAHNAAHSWTWLIQVARRMQKKALTTHHNIAHLGRRDFVCPHENCGRAFGYKHLLQRHLAKIHAPPSSDSGSGVEGEQDETEPDDPLLGTHETDAEGAMDMIDVLTGKAYATRAREAVKQAHKLQCPYPRLPPSFTSEDSPGPASSTQENGCQYVFSRAYDLRRHLQAEHGIVVEREKVDEWVRVHRDGQPVNPT